jgi:hypothetical protein
VAIMGSAACEMRQSQHGCAAKSNVMSRLIKNITKAPLTYSDPSDMTYAVGVAGALACGADIAVQSTHKTLTALSQASMLHLSPYVSPAASSACTWPPAGFREGVAD